MLRPMKPEEQKIKATPTAIWFLTLKKGHKPETFVFFKKKQQQHLTLFYVSLPNITSSATPGVVTEVEINVLS